MQLANQILETVQLLSKTVVKTELIKVIICANGVAKAFSCATLWSKGFRLDEERERGGQEKRTWKVGLFLTCFRSHFLMSKVCKVPPAARPSRLPPTSSHALHNGQQLNRELCATLEGINYIKNALFSSKLYTHELSRLIQLFWLLNCCFSSSSSRLVSINFF
jgi:hypothetical protein